MIWHDRPPRRPDLGGEPCRRPFLPRMATAKAEFPLLPELRLLDADLVERLIAKGLYCIQLAQAKDTPEEQRILCQNLGVRRFVALNYRLPDAVKRLHAIAAEFPALTPNIDRVIAIRIGGGGQWDWHEEWRYARVRTDRGGV